VTLQAQFSNALSWFNFSDNKGLLGIAVSGGSDSMAMLNLAHRQFPGRIRAATVDHGLRPEAADEAKHVAAHCAQIDVPHDILTWTGWTGHGNLQAAARTARYDLLTDWADSHELAHVLLGHTRDDQAETILMRIARGSGVDGLKGMADHSGRFYRPLLGCSRSDLQDWLRNQDIPWIDDPSNDDSRFDRVKARQMMPQLTELGLTQDRLLRLGDHMRKAEASLWQCARDFAQTHVQEDRGDLIFAPQALDLDHSDTEARVLAAALQWVTSAVYRPRFDALVEAVRDVKNGKQSTLAGVLLIPENNGLRLLREAARVQDSMALTPGMIWDGRWHVTGPAHPNYQVRAVGPAIKDCPDWRSSILPRASLMASPGIFDQETLISAPLAGFNSRWQAKTVIPFRTYLESH